jgi:hypothetical protein
MNIDKIIEVHTNFQQTLKELPLYALKFLN